MTVTAENKKLKVQNKKLKAQNKKLKTQCTKLKKQKGAGIALSKPVIDTSLLKEYRKRKYGDKAVNVQAGKGKFELAVMPTGTFSDWKANRKGPDKIKGI
jgi:hypothetical protein